jgi:hypothetical protein
MASAPIPVIWNGIGVRPISGLFHNHRGDDYCRAPVNGGCDHKRKKKAGHNSYSNLCSAHIKRRDRGSSISTPILTMDQQREASRFNGGRFGGRSHA